MWLLPLGIGTTEDVFHAVGNFPERMDVFISFVIAGAMLTAVCFNIMADMLSGPFDLVVSNDNKSTTSPGSHLRFKVTAQGMSLGQAD